ncbi:MAG: exosortase B [Betaproteobacteria bacterium]
MSSVLGVQRTEQGKSYSVLRWAPVVFGLVLMYIPTYLNMWTHYWSREDNAHGPIIVAVVAWLIWRRREVLLEGPRDVRPVAGGLLIFAGLVLYVIGRSQDFAQPDTFSQVPLLLGLILALQGKRAFRTLLFPIAFLTLSVSLPGATLDAFLVPLKEVVSSIVENILYWTGYPIARAGVVLNIGPYQLLIADACSGLNSMIALTCVGLLFVYLTRPPNIAHSAILLAFALPIAFVANVLRVLTLVLVTYYFGDSAGHAFHDYAGYAEIIFAFGVFFLLDAILMRVLPKKPIKPQVPFTPNEIRPTSDRGMNP